MTNVKNKEYIDHAAEALAREIDEEIMATHLVEHGWTKVHFQFEDRYHAVDTELWVAENCTGAWTRHGSSYLFKNAADAAWFILKNKQ